MKKKDQPIEITDEEIFQRLTSEEGKERLEIANRNSQKNIDRLKDTSAIDTKILHKPINI
jgi:hypothetical protein